MGNPIYADFHVHTRFSPCGHRDATLTAMVSRARAKGLAALGFADHVTPAPVPGCDFYDGQQIEVLIEERSMVNAMNLPADLTVLVGVEADYTLAGAGCLDGAMLGQVDYVICAASHFHLPAAPRPREDTSEAKAELMVRMAREMLQMPGVSVWAHPFDCTAMRPLAPIIAAIGDARMAGLIALANDRQVAVEINGGPVATSPAYREATAAFFGLAREMGARFTITADAHHPDDFERLDLALEWAREMRFRDEDFLTVDELLGRRGVA